jgi:phosphoribosylanthranilate isomerase
MTRVKLCGLTSQADVEAAVDAGADAVGVVADVPVDSPREVATDQAAALVDAVPPFVTSVLVTMPDSPARAVELVDAVEPDVLQVHGDLPKGDLAFLVSKLDARIVRAVDASDPAGVREAAAIADAVLVDSLDADGGGGTGDTHDWTATADVVADVDVPVVLAGGLTPDNVADAVRTVRPFAVDVASGIERDDADADATAPAERGRKDPDAARRFVREATTALDREVRA